LNRDKGFLSAAKVVKFDRIRFDLYHFSSENKYGFFYCIY